MVLDVEFIQNEVRKFTLDGFQTIPLSSPVYTRTGRIFEKSQLVELPQLLNILLGQMTLVGCRPLPESNLQELENAYGSELLERRHLRKAGLAGTVQMLGKTNLSSEERLKIEVAEAEYLAAASPLEKSVAIVIILSGVVLSIIFGSVPRLIQQFVDRTILNRIA